MTQVARGDTGQKFKIRGGPMVKICTYFSLSWTPFVGLNGSKNSGEIDTKYVSMAIYFWL